MRGGRQRKIGALAALCASLLTSCAWIDSVGTTNNGTVTDHARNAVKWIQDQLRSAGSRRFDFSLGDFDYRGSDAGLRLLVTNLRDDSQRFEAVQQLLRDVMRDEQFLTVLQQVPVQVVSRDELERKGLGQLDGAYLDGVVYLSETKVAAFASDPRPLLILVVHEFLHAWGFDVDDAVARLVAGNGGTLPVPSVVIPPALRTLRNGQLMNELAAELVLLSQTYRAGLPGDDVKPSSVAWVTISDEDFRGVGGVPRAAETWTSPHWMPVESDFLESKDGYVINRLTSRPPWTTAVHYPDIRTTRTFRDVRVTLDVNIYSSERTNGGRFHLMRGRGPTRALLRNNLSVYRIENLRSPKYLSVGIETGGVATCGDMIYYESAATYLSVRFQMTSVAGKTVLRLNDQVVCATNGIVFDDEWFEFMGVDAALDRVRIDVPVEVSR